MSKPTIEDFFIADVRRWKKREMFAECAASCKGGCIGEQHRDTTAMLFTLQRSRAGLTAPEVPEVDRLCRSITQAVKDHSSAFIVALIRSYPR